jgi:hypothetical protein
VTFAAIRRVAFFESPVIASPNRSRAGFDRIFRSTEHHTASRRSRFDFVQLLEDDRGLYLVAEEPGEKIVLGFIGRWVGPGLWTGHLDQDQFRKFDRCQRQLKADHQAAPKCRYGVSFHVPSTIARDTRWRPQA